METDWHWTEPGDEAERFAGKLAEGLRAVSWQPKVIYHRSFAPGAGIFLARQRRVMDGAENATFLL